MLAIMLYETITWYKLETKPSKRFALPRRKWNLPLFAVDVIPSSSALVVHFISVYKMIWIWVSSKWKICCNSNTMCFCCFIFNVFKWIHTHKTLKFCIGLLIHTRCANSQPIQIGTLTKTYQWNNNKQTRVFEYMKK